MVQRLQSIYKGMVMKSVKLPRLTFWKSVLAVILVVGGYSIFIRFTKGLGASTNLSDSFPWGLWVGFDVMVGVGLAAGGFVITGAVYIFGIEKLKPIARPAVLTAFLGYVFVGISLLFDLGLPYRIYHPMLMWNPHSVMFEVAWCVILYTTVLFLEFSPAALERFHLKTPLKIIKVVTPILVIFGVILSTLHQSSLGTLFLIVPDKLHGLWYSTYLPLFFLVSAISVGLAIVIFESFMSHRAFNRGLELDLLTGLGRAIVVILGLYLVMRSLDLARQGNLSLILEGSRESLLFLLEISLGVLLPIILLLIPRVRSNESGLFLASFFVILGFILNRLNVSITGMQRSAGVAYFPSGQEFAISATLVAVEITLFALAARYLPVFPSRESISHTDIEYAPLQQQPPEVPGGVQVAVWNKKPILLSLGLLFGVGLLVLDASQRETPVTPPPVKPATEAGIVFPNSIQYTKLPADYEIPVGKSYFGKVIFRHTTHVDDKTPNCESCHPALFRLLEPGKPATGAWSKQAMYEQKQCGACHNGTDAFGVDDPESCTWCHTEEFEQAYVHSAIQMADCTSCHDVTNQLQIQASSIAGLCFDCHDEEGIRQQHVHQPVADGDCLSCHDPHTSPNKYQLIKADKELCLSCHETIQEEIAQATVHPPVEDSCTDCHNPHSSPFPKQLSQEESALCVDCHEEIQDQDQAAEVSHPSVVEGKCLKCHTPHGSEQPKLLRAAAN